MYRLDNHARTPMDDGDSIVEGGGSATTTSNEEGGDFLLVRQSREKLQAAAETLKPWLSSSSSSNTSCCCNLLSCATPQDANTYRCRYSFQLLFVEDENESSSSPSSSVRAKQRSRGGLWRYAVRREKQPIVIDSFPIANRQIQRAMRNLLKELNNNSRSSDKNDDDGFTQHLTSVSFSSPWKDDNDNDDGRYHDNDRQQRASASAAAVVVVTLHYDGPIADEVAWRDRARSICRSNNGFCFSQLSGRSKKKLLRAFQEPNEEEGAGSSGAASNDKIRNPSSIYDVLWLMKANETSCWKVTFSNPDSSTLPFRTDDDDGSTPHRSSNDMVIPVHYCKPEGAFFHPNASVMSCALEWLLNRVQGIITSNSTLDGNATLHHRPRLLELYCGCGAHTMSLALSRLFSSITALELDDRLVQALRHNCQLNNLHLVDYYKHKQRQDKDKKEDTRSSNDDCDDDNNGYPVVVECISSDAGTWARQKRRKRQPRDNGNHESCPDEDFLEYDVLLVDPPRNGLDEQVCRLALQQADPSSSSSKPVATFSNILYISCGKEALLRDLERLSTGYEVVNCTLLDLFPQTEAVETLVHLRRR